jgi:hypothetical protein
MVDQQIGDFIRDGVPDVVRHYSELKY